MQEHFFTFAYTKTHFKLKKAGVKQHLANENNKLTSLETFTRNKLQNIYQFL